MQFSISDYFLYERILVKFEAVSLEELDTWIRRYKVSVDPRLSQEMLSIFLGRYTDSTEDSRCSE